MPYSIGQLAEAAGVARSTVRYYERAKLLLPDFRTGGNYREYSEQSLERLKFIRSAQATGFSLHDIGELLSLTHSDEPPCDEVLSLARKRLADVRERLKELGRSLAPALLSGNFHGLWLYLIAPILGAAACGPWHKWMAPHQPAVE